MRRPVESEGRSWRAPSLNGAATVFKLPSLPSLQELVAQVWARWHFFCFVLLRKALMAWSL
jgi:hypothetical protein